MRNITFFHLQRAVGRGIYGTVRNFASANALSAETMMMLRCAQVIQEAEQGPLRMQTEIGITLSVAVLQVLIKRFASPGARIKVSRGLRALISARMAAYCFESVAAVLKGVPERELPLALYRILAGASLGMIPLELLLTPHRVERQDYESLGTSPQRPWRRLLDMLTIGLGAGFACLALVEQSLVTAKIPPSLPALAGKYAAGAFASVAGVSAEYLHKRAEGKFEFFYYVPIAVVFILQSVSKQTYHSEEDSTLLKILQGIVWPLVMLSFLTKGDRASQVFASAAVYADPYQREAQRELEQLREELHSRSEEGAPRPGPEGQRYRS